MESVFTSTIVVCQLLPSTTCGILNRCKFSASWSLVLVTTLVTVSSNRFLALVSAVLMAMTVDAASAGANTHQPDTCEWNPPPYAGIFNPGDIVGYRRCDEEVKARP